MPRTTLLFDLDGTLVDSAHDIAAALNLLRSERGASTLSVGDVRPLVALGVRAVVGTALGDAAGASDDDIAIFRAHLREIRPDPASVYPGVRAALAALAVQEWRMAIVTNKPEALSRSLLAALDLARYFETIVGGDTTRHAKPAADPLLFALSVLGVKTGEAVFIGDSAIDSAAARATDMPFVLFLKGYGAADCVADDVTASFNHFTELPAQLATMRE